MGHVIKGIFVCIFLLFFTMAGNVHAFITDDTGTQGKGKFEIDIDSQLDFDKETVKGVSVESTGSQVSTTLTYGFIDNADVILNLPYTWSKVKEDGVTVHDENGVSDTTVEIKWRFFEKEGFSLALKPGVILPTGDDKKGLGTGSTGYHAYLIGSKEVEPWAFHVNLGYIANENKGDEEKNIWHASLAAEYKVGKNLKLVGNIGVERNRDKTADNDPAFILGGMKYAFSEHFEVNCGVKYGLTAAETEWSLLSGISFMF